MKSTFGTSLVAHAPAFMSEVEILSALAEEQHELRIEIVVKFTTEDYTRWCPQPTLKQLVEITENVTKLRFKQQRANEYVCQREFGRLGFEFSILS
ncbi:unnamed protein product [Bursaphelenchus okinawaensis]|uniref:Uncharacterized protein n=1 Tax=Bursaphelenchus okinawaensis TaxID=465554 RepID=A0A811JV65_9BILA|nr:unnamed protein product [Bursaphelenchus okinawaensis]CAG9084573.1 unnamed protein product [Bursaphelenchus okinawaensis]